METKRRRRVIKKRTYVRRSIFFDDFVKVNGVIKNMSYTTLIPDVVTTCE